MRVAMRGLATVCGILLAAATAAQAQTFPSRPITLVVPYAPGGTGDVMGRMFAQKMAESLGQNVVVELKPGAGGNIGAEYVAKQARPDGYTIMFATLSLATNAALMKLNFDVKRDLAPIAGLAAFPTLLMVSGESPYKSVAELIAAGKKGEHLSFGSSGPGTASHLSGEIFRIAAGVPMTHVPYKGSGAVYPDLISGRVTMLFEIAGGAIGRVSGGKVRALAVTSPKRISALPEVPTMEEAGLGAFELISWSGMFTRAGTPPEVVSVLEHALLSAMKAPDVEKWLAGVSADPVPASTAEFTTFYRNEVDKWQRLVREGKIEPLQ
jgi:tripartite-type tricarboxylate transporter receptor subunit TctC